jgi:hypothetical protein
MDQSASPNCIFTFICHFDEEKSLDLTNFGLLIMRNFTKNEDFGLYYLLQNFSFIVKIVKSNRKFSNYDQQSYLKLLDFFKVEWGLN